MLTITFGKLPHRYSWLSSTSMANELKWPTQKLAKQALNLQSYDFDIEHWPGKKHGNADALFRRVNVITKQS